jgi:hypothetical protein
MSALGGWLMVKKWFCLYTRSHPFPPLSNKQQGGGDQGENGIRRMDWHTGTLHSFTAASLPASRSLIFFYASLGLLPPGPSIGC